MNYLQVSYHQLQLFMEIQGYVDIFLSQEKAPSSCKMAKNKNKNKKSLFIVIAIADLQLDENKELQEHVLVHDHHLPIWAMEESYYPAVKSN